MLPLERGADPNGPFLCAAPAARKSSDAGPESALGPLPALLEGALQFRHSACLPGFGPLLRHHRHTVRTWKPPWRSIFSLMSCAELTMQRVMWFCRRCTSSLSPSS